MITKLTKTVINKKNNNNQSLSINSRESKVKFNHITAKSIIWERDKWETILISVMNNDNLMEEMEPIITTV
jgi:hypothetical protein